MGKLIEKPKSGKALKYPKVHEILKKNGREKYYKQVYKRMEKGMTMTEAIDEVFNLTFDKTKEINYEKYHQKQQYIKPQYYTTDKEIERQILFDNKQLTYTLDELSEEEKQLLN